MAGGDKTRALIVVSCTEGYKGTGRKGEFTIYNIEATTDDGSPVTQSLRSFDDLTPLIGKVAEFDVKPYRGNKGLTYTLYAKDKPKAEDRIKQLEERVGQLELAVRAAVSGDSKRALALLGDDEPGAAAGAASSAVAPDDSDVPF